MGECGDPPIHSPPCHTAPTTTSSSSSKWQDPRVFVQLNFSQFQQFQQFQLYMMARSGARLAQLYCRGLTYTPGTHVPRGESPVQWSQLSFPLPSATWSCWHSAGKQELRFPTTSGGVSGPAGGGREQERLEVNLTYFTSDLHKGQQEIQAIFLKIRPLLFSFLIL